MSEVNCSPTSAPQVERETSKVAAVNGTTLSPTRESNREDSKRERRLKRFLIVLLRSFSMYVM